MNRNTVLKASGIALVALLVWWASTIVVDSMAARMFPYDQYETLALLYPNVFYPGLPGWILASAQPFSIGVWIVAIGWMMVVSLIIGAVAVRFGPEWGVSPNVSAVVVVGALFVVVTVVEAAASFVV